jgi:hypothetical protein
MKRLVVLSVALCAFAVSVPVAETAPTQPNGCTVEHLSNAECQGPDFLPAANACEITTWVGNASCELTVPDGVASNAGASTVTHAVLQEATSTWHAEFDYVIRDKGTGQVLFSREDALTTPVGGGPNIPTASFGFGGALPQQGGAEVVCEVTGTHTPAGAAMSAVAAVEGFGQFNNTMRCEVN